MIVVEMVEMTEGERLVAARKASYESWSFSERLARVLRFARGSVRVGEIKDERAAIKDAVKYIAWHGSDDERFALEAAAVSIWFGVGEEA